MRRNVDEDETPDFSSYPLPGGLIIDQALEFNVFPELIHFKEVYENMNTHPEPKVREKYLTTWNMYSLAYPGLTRSLVKHNFDLRGMAELDWSEAEKIYKVDYTK